MIGSSAALAEVMIGHPLTQPYSLPVSPLAAGVAAMLAVLAVALAWPERTEVPSTPAARTDSWSGAPSTAQVVVRAGALLLTFLAIAAGRFGVDDELENLAPALVVGVAWPVLTLLSIAAGRIWQWVDPWDGAARILSPRDEIRIAAHVWPALAPAIAWTWYLSVSPAPLSPRAVGAALGLYTIFALAGCLAAGRVRWLSSAEPIGLAFSWMALLPTRHLRRWQPPRGAELLLGVLAGGVLFGALRHSELWGALNVAPAARLYATIGLLLSCAGFGGLLFLLAEQAGRYGPRALVARAAVPALAAIIVAVAMDRNRLSTSLQLLPALLGDPFGLGWDLLGAAGRGLIPAPLGVTGLAVAQLAVLVGGHVAGAIVLGSGATRIRRGPAAAALGVLTASSVVALLAH